MDSSLTGQLLVAAPVLDDPNFHRVIVFVLDHDEDGALGLVLNRATDTPLDDAIDGWSDLAAFPGVMFSGGPVDPTSIVALGSSVDVASEGETTITHGIRLVDLDADPVLATTEMDHIRVFIGYAGWAPEQLEEEIDQGAWIVVDAEPFDVFTPDPDGLYHAVLRRQEGDLRLLSTFPADPSLN